MAIDVQKLKSMTAPDETGFQIRKLGHIVIRVSDLERSTAFYTGILGFKVSDVYPEEMMPGGMVFLRCQTDHHSLALVGAGRSSQNQELHHFAFEVATLAELTHVRDRLLAHSVKIDFEGRRRAGCQIAVEFRDPDGYSVEVYWSVDQVGTDGRTRPSNEWHGAKSIADAIAHPVPGQDTYLPER
ncbi:MAG TPA: VOC family protein [Terriglobales bacterium]|nr:VOC family protein [Terriglobales bacterium]